MRHPSHSFFVIAKNTAIFFPLCNVLKLTDTIETRNLKIITDLTEHPQKFYDELFENAANFAWVFCLQKDMLAEGLRALIVNASVHSHVFVEVFTSDLSSLNGDFEWPTDWTTPQQTHLVTACRYKIKDMASSLEKVNAISKGTFGRLSAER